MITKRNHSTNHIKRTSSRRCRYKHKPHILCIYISIPIIVCPCSIQIKFPSAEDLQKRADEGREKDKKHHGYIMIPLLLGSTIIPIAYGALALLAGKALIVSKLALVLASIIGIKKLVSHSGDGGGSSRRYGMADEPQQFGNARGFELPKSVLRS